MFIAALFAIAKIWKQPKCPSVDEWIKQLWNIYTMEYSWTIKKKESLPFVKAGMKLGSIILTSQSEKDRYHMISLVCESNEQNKLINKVETDSHTQKTDWQLSESRGVEELGEKGEGSKQKNKNKNKNKKNPKTKLNRRQNYGDYQRERGWGEVEDKGERNGDGRRLDLGWWTHNAIYRGCMIEFYTWKLYNFINQCHPNKFNF